jgi:S-adenosyl methyltransferase
VALTTVVEADARDPEQLLSHLRFGEIIDLDRPVAILLFSVLTDLPDGASAMRITTEVELFFGELELVEPGVVYVPRWRPDKAMPCRPDSVWVAGGIGRKERSRP